MRLIPIALILLAFTAPAHALRCGNQLVMEGMTRHEVRERCGNPDDTSRRFETVYRQTEQHEAVAIEIEIEEWFYDFGSNRLDRRVIFVNGRVHEIEVAQ
ncbi:MAG: DUF2845 domain-containing protein [Rhodanobacteraceae bacterium]|nr:DUF2845 domain-containing protein [Rhodanobacteraceae bacterium]